MKYAASRLSVVQPSASMAVSGMAKALTDEGHDVIDLGLGEPDFDTPAHIVEAAHAAALAGKTRYEPTGGAPELKQAIARKLARENDLTYAPDEIIVSNGAKQVIYNALMATLEPGEEVMHCAPYFDIYKTITLVLGGVPKILSCSAADGFRLTPEALEQAIGESTRWLLLNSPSNPAGATYDKAQLAALGEVLARHPQVFVLADEIYEHIIFDDQPFTSFATACPDLRDRMLTVNGVSKAFAMTGWRIGYGAGPRELINAMTTVQSQVTSGACAIAQAAAAAALDGPQDDVRRFREAFERRRNLVVAGAEKIPGLTLAPPGGAFYTFIGCEEFIGTTAPDGTVIEDDIGFAKYLLNEGKVAAVPGSAYGLSPFIRFSTATSDEKLSQAMTRMADCLSKLTTSPSRN